MLGRHIFNSRFRFSFENKQRDLRKPIMHQESTYFGHNTHPKSFKKSLLLLAFPSMYYLGGIIEPFQSSQHLQTLSVLFDNTCLAMSSMAGLVYYFNIVSKSDYSYLKQLLVEAITVSIPFALFVVSCTLFHEYQSVASFATLYPGLALFIYGAQNVQTYGGVPSNLFRLAMLSGVSAFIASLILLLVHMSRMNQKKSLILKLDELQRLSDVMRNKP